MCCLWALLGECKSLDLHANIRSFMTMQKRGPDSSRMDLGNTHVLGFHRLAINDLSVAGQQPFTYNTESVNYFMICNGEIYNADQLKADYDISVKSSSDCAVILPLFVLLEHDFTRLNQILHGEYSLIILKVHPNDSLEFFASTDPLSVRPLFMCTNDSTIAFSSLLHGLTSFQGNVQRVPQCSYIIGTYNAESNKIVHKQGRYFPYIPHTMSNSKYDAENMQLYSKIVDTLSNCIDRRLISDVPIGCLLSGGLDSSLVAAIASRKMALKGQRLRTFSIGMEGSTDVAYALKVAKHIGSQHTTVTFTQQEGLNAIADVLRATETFDITTVRASVGQFLLSKYIKENTNIRVLLNGDGADECQMGYLYFYLAPSDEEAQKDSFRLMDEIHLYDGLRVDRCLSFNGLEARVPFLDKDFVDLYRQIHPQLKRPSTERMEKHLIRKAFEVMYKHDPIIPNDVLWRQKEAFSDGISCKEKSWYLVVQEHIETIVCDENYSPSDWNHVPPPSKEAYYYRYMFNSLFGDRCSSVIPKYWMPSWIDTSEPSARILSIYK
jgi:asparagine synthase (glutamine-hydrolysing)